MDRIKSIKNIVKELPRKRLEEARTYVAFTLDIWNRVLTRIHHEMYESLYNMKLHVFRDNEDLFVRAYGREMYDKVKKKSCCPLCAEATENSEEQHQRCTNCIALPIWGYSEYYGNCHPCVDADISPYGELCEMLKNSRAVTTVQQNRIINLCKNIISGLEVIATELSDRYAAILEEEAIIAAEVEKEDSPLRVFAETLYWHQEHATKMANMGIDPNTEYYRQEDCGIRKICTNTMDFNAALGLRNVINKYKERRMGTEIERRAMRSPDRRISYIMFCRDLWQDMSKYVENCDPISRDINDVKSAVLHLRAGVYREKYGIDRYNHVREQHNCPACAESHKTCGTCFLLPLWKVGNVENPDAVPCEGYAKSPYYILRKKVNTVYYSEDEAKRIILSQINRIVRECDTLLTKNKKEGTMIKKKSDLKTGMIVEYDNGDLRMVLLDTPAGSLLKGYELGAMSHLELGDVPEDLASWDCPGIAKIWAPTSETFAFGNTDKGYKVVYDATKLTVQIAGKELEMTMEGAESLVKELQYLLKERKSS